MAFSASLKHHNLVSIIFVNYNGASNLQELFCDFLESLANQTYKNIQVIMVDNASNDRSVSLAKKIIPNIVVIQLRKNLGYVRAVNIGARRANGKFLIVCNNDIILSNTFVEDALKILHMATTSVCSDLVIVCPLQVVEDGKRILGTMPKINFLGQALHIDYRSPFDRFIRMKSKLPFIWPVPYPDGACFILTRDVLTTLQFLLNPYFFMYFDDVELGIRLSLIGGKTFFARDLLIYHKLSGTSMRAIPYDKFIYYNVNRLCTFLALLNPFQLFLLFPVLIFFDLAELFIISTRRSSLHTHINNIYRRYIRQLLCNISMVPEIRAYYAYLFSRKRGKLNEIFEEYLFLPKWLYYNISSSKKRYLLLLFGVYFLNGIASIIRVKGVKKFVVVDTIV